MFKNTLYLFAGRISNAVFLFLLTLVVSRQLGPALFGVFSFLTTVVIAASCFANLGLDTWMVREITKDPERGRHYLSNILGLKTGASLTTIGLILLIFQSADLPETTRHLLWVISASILFNSLRWRAEYPFRRSFFILHEFPVVQHSDHFWQGDDKCLELGCRYHFKCSAESGFNPGIWRRGRRLGDRVL